MGAARGLIRRGAVACALLASCADVDPTGAAASLIRPDQPGIGPPMFDATERVETFASRGGTFLVHFSRAGRNAVPAVDMDSDGTPDYVQETAELYDRVLAFYRDTRGFHAPPNDMAVTGGNGGDARFDVYLVDFAGRADGAFRRESCDPARDVACPGYMVQENDFTGYPYPSTRVATTILSSHEFFHAVQAGYDVRRGSILEEATAVWGTEQFDPTLTDFEGFVPGYLSRPDRSLDQVQTGPVDEFSYGAAIFFQFLTERHDAAIVSRLWAACAMDDGTTSWVDILDAVLRRDYASSFAAEYAEFTVWNLYTGARANPRRAYAHGASYPLVATTRQTLPFMDNQVRLFHAATRYYTVVPGDRAQITAAFVAPAGAASDALDGLELRLAVRRGSVVDEPHRLASVTAGTETVDVTGATEVIVLLTNVRSTGASSTPGLCLGSPDEVAQCRATIAPTMDSDAGADAGADASADAAPEAAVDAGAAAPPASGGCACATGASHTGAAGAWGALLAGLAGVLRRRRAAA